MDVKPGYKQTDAGVIPEEWSTATIKELATIATGKRNTQDRIEDGAYPFYVRSQTIERIDTFSFDGEAVLTAGDGVGTGKVFHYINGRFDCHQRVYRISDFSVPISGYFFYLYFSTHFYDRIMSMTAKSSVDSVRMDTIADMVIPLPPLPEQQAIAVALGDVDALIESLDLLIAKKRDLKQAAMQQLLTGQTRLPGFSSEWEAKRLGDVVDFLDGSRRPVKDADRAKMRGDFPYYGASGIVDYVNDYIFDEELILLGEDGENILSRNCPLAFRVSGKIWVNNHAHVLRPKPCFDIGFLAAYLESLNYEQHNTGTAQPKLNKRVCANISVRCPPASEQSAIAEVLSDVDTEIAALEARRDKTKLLKEGMMQELLTGRTRLL